MAESELLVIAKRVQQFILDQFDEDELRQCVYYLLDGTDLDRVVKAARFEQRVFELITWSLRVGLFRRLATAVAEGRPNVPQGAALLAAVNALPVAPPLGTSASEGNILAAGKDVAVAAIWRFPNELETITQLHDQAVRKSADKDRGRLVLNFVNNFASFPFDRYDLPDHVYLSESSGLRLFAVLSLRKRPLTRCLRWLAERVAVEGSSVGLLAAQSLMYAAVRLPRADLERVRAAVQEALSLLKEVTTDWVSRVQELQQALEAVEKRLGGSMISLPVIEYDELLTALIDAFDRPGFEELCDKQLGVGLSRIVNTSGPIEYVAFMVVRLAEQAAWVQDLIREAYGQRPAHMGLRKIYQSVQGLPAL